jgi:predicted CXXCH cytochrome family protein
LELWKGSVHGEALLKRGNLSAPACNDCHGSHGAMPPDVDSVANACGRCHIKIAGLFAQARMRHQFEEVGLPGCATCHGNHDIRSPSDEMLGMGDKAVCVHCHADGQFGAPLAGAKTASAMRARLEQLKARLAEADSKLSRAARLGMDVQGPRYDLYQAFTALTNARSLVHSFSLDPMNATLDEGLQIADRAILAADDALRLHNTRRIWLGVSLVPALLVMLLLVRYIRTLPSPTVAVPPPAEAAEVDRPRSSPFAPEACLFHETREEAGLQPSRR